VTLSFSMTMTHTANLCTKSWLQCCHHMSSACRETRKLLQISMTTDEFQHEI